MRPLLALLVVSVVAPVTTARAGGSSPLLTLLAVDAFASASGAKAVDARGSFNFEDVVEGVFPAGLVVYQGTRFARFDQAGTVVSGTAPSLANGLDASEVPALVGQGSPAGTPAALTQIRTDRVSVVLPPGFSPGAASAVLYAVYESQGYVSNTLAVTLP